MSWGFANIYPLLFIHNEFSKQNIFFYQISSLKIEKTQQYI